MILPGPFLAFNFLIYLVMGVGWKAGFTLHKDSTKVEVKKTADFNVSGDGMALNWNSTDWLSISRQESSTTKNLQTKVKLLYSDLGLYFLFNCEDQEITATLQEDFTALKEDVIEVFLWPDQSVPIYFEYELSPLNYELPILVRNLNGRIQGWAPWRYEGKRKVRHATSVGGGDKKSNAASASWSAEFFIPFALLSPIIPGKPGPGTEWRANLYRIDYDDGYTTWTWQKTTLGKGGNFHEYKKFGTLVFR